MQTARLHRIFIIAGVLSLLASYLGIWIRFINDPVERTGSDFIAFYSAGRVAQQYGTANVYDPVLQQEIQEQEVGFPLVKGQVLLYNHLPFLIPVLQTIVSPSYVSSFYRWIILLVSAYTAAVLVLARFLQREELDRNSVLLAIVGAFLFLPVFFSLMNGQDTALLFLGAVIWMYGLMAGKDWAAGLGLSLTTVRPHIALLLALPMLFRSIKVFSGFVLGSGILALLSVLVVGRNGIVDYINVLLVSAGGEWYGMKEYAMYNLIGLLTRAVPSLGADTIRLLGWSVYGIALIGLCILWFTTRDSKPRLIGFSVVVALFVVPHLHFHDLTLLLIPIYELIYWSGEPGNVKTSIAISMPIAISLLLLLSNISPFLQYSVPYLVMLLFVLFPYSSKLRGAITIPHQS